MTQQLSQAEFNRLGNKPSNRRVGNFLYIHEEENPRGRHFFDMKGNTVIHGGQDGPMDVRISITPEDKATLVPRLVAYMVELLGRHGGTLHSFGEWKFDRVIIRLPYRVFTPVNFEVTIHSMVGKQAEIAYEVMAALSGIPVYKAIAPLGSYYSFDRMDKIDDGKWVTYWHHMQGIRVAFNHVSDLSSVVVSKSIHLPREDWEKFKGLMYDFVDEYVYAMTGKKMLKEKGFHSYSSTMDDSSVTVDVDSGTSFSFAVSIPYGGEATPFPRLAFAKRAMEMLSESFSTNKTSTG
jgi:hypothetical protein